MGQTEYLFMKKTIEKDKIGNKTNWTPPEKTAIEVINFTVSQTELNYSTRSAYKEHKGKQTQL